MTNKSNIIGIFPKENSSACLLQDGKIIAVGEEERFNRIKTGGGSLPLNSIKYVLEEGNISKSIDIIHKLFADIPFHFIDIDVYIVGSQCRGRICLRYNFITVKNSKRIFDRTCFWMIHRIPKIAGI